MVNSDNFVTWIEENLSLTGSAIAHDVITSHKKKMLLLIRVTVKLFELSQVSAIKLPIM